MLSKSFPIWSVREIGRYDAGSWGFLSGFRIGEIIACLNFDGIFPVFQMLLNNEVIDFKKNSGIFLKI